MNVLAFPQSSPGSGEPTVAAVINQYLSHLELRESVGQYSAAALERARRYLGSFSGRYGSQGFSLGRTTDLTRWLHEHPEWKSDSTKNDAITAVLVCFRWAADEEQMIAHVPYRRPKGLRLKPRPRGAFTLQEFRRLLAGSRNHRGVRRRPSAVALRCALHFLWRTGARTCEMRLALWQQLDRELGVIRQAHHKTEAITGEDRLIGLDDGLLRLLRWMKWRSRRNERPCTCPAAKHEPHAVQDHIFLNGRGRPWNRASFARLFRTFADRAGIDRKKSAYCLRHGFCVQAITAGVGERQIADQMGHSSTRQISWYGRQARQRAEHLRAVVRQAGKRTTSQV